jgi:hypothetical protein
MTPFTFGTHVSLVTDSELSRLPRFIIILTKPAGVAEAATAKEKSVRIIKDFIISYRINVFNEK